MFYFLSKGLSNLLICGGSRLETEAYEVINIKSPTTICKNLPNFPSTIFGSIGGLEHKDFPIICGGQQDGTHSNRCYSLKNNEWVSSSSMNSVRSYAAAVQLPDGKILVTGGYNGSLDHSSAEMLTEEGWESNIPSLPVAIAQHCMVAVNSTTVMVLGGFQNYQVSGRTFYFTPEKGSWSQGPNLKYMRRRHSCGRVRRDKESQAMSIIVAGGSDNSFYLSSVEILDESSHEWWTGPELPFGIQYSQMVDDPQGGVILIGGESKLIGYTETLYQLPHGGKDAEWIKMEQELSFGRHLHTAFLVPANSVGVKFIPPCSLRKFASLSCSSSQGCNLS